jgi:hypothetical protein
MRTLIGLMLAAHLLATPAMAQQHNPQVLIAAQKEAMAKLAFMDGVWRGPASTVLPNGDKHEVTQTERVGPLLDGSIKLVEGRGYLANGATGFNAFATISYDVAKAKYTMHSHAMGNVGDFTLVPTADGFTWEIPAGPMTIRYVATIKDGTWHEVGDRIMPGKEPVRFIEMKLKRIGDSSWPGAGAIPPK